MEEEWGMGGHPHAVWFSSRTLRKRSASPCITVCVCAYACRCGLTSTAGRERYGERVGNGAEGSSCGTERTRVAVVTGSAVCVRVSFVSG